MADTTENAQGTTRTGVNDIKAAVENAKAAKDEGEDTEDDDDAGDEDDSDDAGEGDDDGAENQEEDTEESDDADGDEDGDDDEEEDNPDEKKSQKTDRKYKQYAGDGSDKSYISNLEKALQSSSSEAVSIKTELNQANGRVDAIMRAAASNPELAKMLNAAINGSGTGDGGGKGSGSEAASAADNPFVSDLKAQWTQKSEQEIETFIEANPEVVSDPKVKEDVQHWMKVFSEQHFQRTGRLLSGGEAMSQAYKHLGLENKLEKQNLAAGAKKSAAPTRPRGKSKKASGQKANFSPDQLAMAKAMGKDESWLSKNAK
jgi:hypothetical protein